MSPITHFMAGWVAFEGCLHNRRDRAIVCLAGLAPDLDGVGLIIDLCTNMETDFYQSWHRMYGHGIMAALVFAFCAALLGHDRLRVGIATFLNVHLHFLCDLLGSRGSTPDDLWGLYYLGPWTERFELVWQGQWELTGWQNLSISIVLLALLLERGSRKGYTPVGLISPVADRAFVGVLRKWRAALW